MKPSDGGFSSDARPEKLREFHWDLTAEHRKGLFWRVMKAGPKNFVFRLINEK
ncbi:MAG: hypothetical protein ABII00_09025 [Elusimicrobiota bacterium]